MKTKIFTGVLLVCSIVICIAATIDINGKWKGVLTTDDGNDIPLTYLFKVDGNKLGGEIEASVGNLPITNGTIKGDSINFTVNYNGADIPNHGKCYTDSIAMNTELNGATFHFILKRDK